MHAHAPTRWDPDTLAVIDLGSNTFRLELVRVGPQRFDSLRCWKEPIRLGAGLDAEGRLSEAAITKALDCLGRFRALLEHFPRDRVRAVATQTLRQAHNRAEVLSRAEAVLGWPIDVVPGEEEARLIHVGVSRLHPNPAPRLVLDIGGRSTELVLGEGDTARDTASVPIGSVGLTVQFFPEGRFTPAAFEAAQATAHDALAPLATRFGRRTAAGTAPRWTEALGTSGTAGAVAQIVHAANLSNGPITPESLRWCIDACLQAGELQHLQLPGLRDDRRNVAAGGLCILAAALPLLGIEALRPVKGALRHGMAFEMQDQLDAP